MPSNKPFPFLRLPLELRLQIYQNALSYPGLIEYTGIYSWGEPKPELGVNLLLTCSKVYSEARDVLYSNNTFFVMFDLVPLREPKGLLLSDEQLRNPTLKLMQNIFLVGFGRHNHHALGLERLLERLSALRSLKISLVLNGTAIDYSHHFAIYWMIGAVTYGVPLQCEVVWDISGSFEEKCLVNWVVTDGQPQVSGALLATIAARFRDACSYCLANVLDHMWSIQAHWVGETRAGCCRCGEFCLLKRPKFKCCLGGSSVDESLRWLVAQLEPDDYYGQLSRFAAKFRVSRPSEPAIPLVFKPNHECCLKCREPEICEKHQKARKSTKTLALR